MSKFNGSAARAVAAGPIQTGFARDAKSELFLLAITNMVGEKTFYETAIERDSRFAGLVRTIALNDLDWLTRFGRWLRTEVNMRSVSLVLAAEAAKATNDAGQHGGRELVNAVLQRADEPGEMVAYWLSHYGRRLPKPVKRGIADAAARLYNERSTLKWDSAGHGIRFADVIQLTHPDPQALWQSELFKYLVARRWGNDVEPSPRLQMLHANAHMRTHSPEHIKTLATSGHLAELLRLAGMTWEAIPVLVQGPWTAELWSAAIPTMGYMALTRNLRNFDQAHVSDDIAEQVAARLSDPQQVARSGMLPMQFLSAYRAAPSLRWAYPLEKALDLSLANIPQLRGRTLVLVDTSSSMDAGFSKDGTLRRWDAAALFGIGLAARCESADLVSFSSTAQYWGQPHNAHTREFTTTAGESLLKALDRWKQGGWFLGGGTATAAAVRRHFNAHDRVVILTDEQAQHDGQEVGQALPKQVPLYTWNLAGYKRGHAAGGPNRHTFGGLTDKAFTMIPLLERGRDCDWPF
jgi:hypothetical protein